MYLKSNTILQVISAHSGRFFILQLLNSNTLWALRTAKAERVNTKNVRPLHHRLKNDQPSQLDDSEVWI